ncbi:LacI family transcriptional regulator [Actinopolyspora biskrensis]|uniref:LacI family transcriptional regulator n=1 Tax=Actinopolyspora biskrensis TaxID=1470178 RepID=A0A852YUI2_9ACTN|nr:LacI family transcriptional regulator [Actinopolyspora biskrensis]
MSVVTIRDVAARAGVSQATASRALTGSDSVSAGAVAQVQAAVDELGYRTNRAARSLRTHRTDTIGLLISDVRNPFFSELSYAIEQAAAEQGIAVITTNADERVERQTDSLRALTMQQVDGLIIVPQGGGAFEEISEDIPVVLLDRRVTGADAPVVHSDNRAGSQLMIDHLVGLGHTDIALISGPQATSTGQERFAAAIERLHGHGCGPREDCLVEGDFQLASGYRAATRLLDLPRRPSAIFAGDNLMAFGALQAIREQGLRIGHDVALVSFDDTDWFPLLDPPMTVISQDVHALGMRAFDTLQARMDGQDAQDACLPVRITVRGSCGAGSTALRARRRS